jgi:asparagine synthase (glutamine-hydrolysing)
VREERYWDPERLPPEAIDRSADVQLTELVAQAVERQVVGESPVGVFLSGGVDSSLLTVLAARALGPDRLAAFTVRFPDRDYDESADAASVACRAGVRHVTVTADDDALCNALREVTTRVAEPIADPAVLPTLLLARAARSHGAVALAGEGADELFGGYPTYLGHRLAPAWQRLPRPVRSAVERAVQRLPQSAGKVPLEYLARRFVAEAGRPPLERHVAWFGAGLGAAATALLEREAVQQGDPVELAMAFDYRTFLRDGLLVKLDRATMLASLEARAPYLDRAVTEFALRLPPQLKVRGLTTKWVLKRAARRHLPPATVRRRKRGLSVPVARLLRTRLRAEVERLLAPERLDSEALLPVPRAAQLLSAHLSGQANYGRALYAVLAWSLWKEHWLGE